MADRLALDAPVDDPTVDWIWRAWNRLSDDRPYYGGGMSAPVPGRIPWTSLDAWATRYGLSRPELAMLDTCCQSMDAIYLEWWRSVQVKDVS